ncbi:MAG: hypothetical protein QM758_04780 [Armatimonas sp.]
MPSLGLGDLDPKLAEAIKPLLVRATRHTPSAVEPNAPEPSAEWRLVFDRARALGPIRSREAWWLNVLLIFAGLFGTIVPFLAILAYGLDSFGRHPAFLLSPAFTIAAFVLWTGLWWWIFLRTINRWTQLTFQHYLQSPVLQAICPLLTLTTLESEYMDTIGAVLQADRQLGTDTAHGLLESLNELLTAGRRLEREQETLRAAQARQSLSQIEAERNALQQRLTTISDAIARETLSESLSLCNKRLARAQELVPLQERVEAQLDGIVQTMRSVQTSVASLSLTPGRNDLAELRESARGLVLRTRAIEDAVQEVLRITR